MNRPAALDGDGPLVLLVDSTNATERGLLSAWLRDTGAEPVAVLPVRGPETARRLLGFDADTAVAAVRVAWLPLDRKGEGRDRAVRAAPPASPSSSAARPSSPWTAPSGP
jgi:hypothetical protein